jgi:hypothetical protein
MNCTRCQRTGFINLHQVDETTLALFEEAGEHDVILAWIESQTEPHDVSVCDCCGDGQEWHGTPGFHWLNSQEPFPECY